MCDLKSIPILIIMLLISQTTHSQSVNFVTNDNDSGPGSFRLAMMEAASGDTIRFTGDIDTIRLTSGELLINKTLVIAGNPGRTCILRSDTTIHFRIFNIASPESIRVELIDLCISSGKAPDGYNPDIHGQPGGGISIADSIHEIVLKGCVLKGNMSGNGYRKYVANKSGNGGNGGGIYSLSKLTLENCVLGQNHCGSGAEGWSGGEWDSQSGGNGGSGGGIFCLNNLELTGCTFTQNKSGDGGEAIGGTYSAGGDGGSGGSAGAIYCMNREVLIMNTSFENNNSGKGGDASNYQTYCKAGGAGGGGALVLVNCSSQLTNANLIGNFTGRGAGGFGNPSGSPSGGGPGGAVFAQGGQLICSSCTVNYNYTGTGSGSGSEYDIENFSGSGHGAGMYIDTSLFFIQNSSFTGNYTLKGANIGYFVSGGSGGNGGGIYVNRSASPSMITNCLFQENHTGDGITIGNQFEHGVLSGANGGHGGGIYIRKSTPVLLIIGCVFKSNYCGNSVIPSDMAGQPYFYLFPDGGSGGAVCNAGSNVQIINSTIAGNYCGTATIYTGDSLNLVPADSVRGKGGGLYGVNEVINSIIAENSIGNEFPNELEGTGNVNYSMITNDTLAEFSGIGNLLNVTPGFLNFPADLSLAQNSIAINHGSPDTTGLFLPETDMAGNPRIYGDRIDMGAYEFQGEPNWEEIDSFSNDKVCFSVFPNPFAESTIIRITGLDQEALKFSVYSIEGRKVFLKNFGNTGNDPLEINWNGTDLQNNALPPGIYFLELTSGNTRMTAKVVKSSGK